MNNSRRNPRAPGLISFSVVTRPSAFLFGPDCL